MKKYKTIEFLLYNKSSLPICGKGDGTISLILEGHNIRLRVIELQDQYVEKDIKLDLNEIDIARLEQYASRQNRIPKYYDWDGTWEDYILKMTDADGNKKVVCFNLSDIKPVLKDILPKEYYNKIFQN